MNYSSFHKTLLIVKREYLSRVKKKSFIIMTFVGPLLMAALVLAPAYLSQVKDPVYNITVVDETGLFHGKLEETENIRFQYASTNLAETKKSLYGSDNYSILYIPYAVLNSSKGVLLLSEKQLSHQVVIYLKNTISKGLENAKLRASGIDPKILAGTRVNIAINIVKLTTTGEENENTDLAIQLSFAGGLLIYIFIFIYGSQVMRGVIEEKTSRIVEIIISSVRPFQLMMGKIIGIALVSLTQFILWILLTLSLTTITGHMIQASKKGPDMNIQSLLNSQSETLGSKASLEKPQIALSSLFSMFEHVNGTLIGSVFLFYFLGGYLLYGAFFAAIGAAVDSETDTQQFMLPLTIPLILSFLMSQVIINNPEGSLAFWFSIIPLTSPVVMMLRIPFGVPAYELFLSMVFLIIGFVISTWMAARIYRTGILMYGKKVTYRELGKWLFYKK
jgi:ABC-2 type transport system permease protein